MLTGRKRLREWIDRCRLTQVEAARLIGIHSVSLSQFLTGVRVPGLLSANRIEAATGISTHDWTLSSVSASADDSKPRAGKRKLGKG